MFIMCVMNLFDSLETANKQIPLAETLRPKTLDEYLGQNQIVGNNAAFINLLRSGRLFSCIFWGPPDAEKLLWQGLLQQKQAVSL